jgi:hypothetical protein
MGYWGKGVGWEERSPTAPPPTSTRTSDSITDVSGMSLYACQALQWPWVAKPMQVWEPCTAATPVRLGTPEPGFVVVPFAVELPLVPLVPLVVELLLAPLAAGLLPSMQVHDSHCVGGGQGRRHDSWVRERQGHSLTAREHG